MSPVMMKIAGFVCRVFNSVYDPHMAVLSVFYTGSNQILQDEAESKVKDNKKVRYTIRFMGFTDF